MNSGVGLKTSAGAGISVVGSGGRVAVNAIVGDGAGTDSGEGNDVGEGTRVGSAV